MNRKRIERQRKHTAFVSDVSNGFDNQGIQMAQTRLANDTVENLKNNHRM